MSLEPESPRRRPRPRPDFDLVEAATFYKPWRSVTPALLAPPPLPVPRPLPLPSAPSPDELKQQLIEVLRDVLQTLQGQHPPTPSSAAGAEVPVGLPQGVALDSTLNPTDRLILRACRKKAWKGEALAKKVGGKDPDYVRARCARLVRAKRLRVTDDGYRTV